MTPEVVFAMLACARLGVPHSVVFAGFSSQALRDRTVDCHSRFVITTDEGMRGGQAHWLEEVFLDEALDDTSYDFVKHVMGRTGNPTVKVVAGRDVWVDEALLS
jgi:acetyl-CoA synthetase